jgi:hypothetical protein
MEENSHPLLEEGLDMTIIVEVRGREILDSRRNPTVELGNRATVAPPLQWRSRK